LGVSEGEGRGRISVLPTPTNPGDTRSTPLSAGGEEGKGTGVTKTHEKDNEKK